MENNFGLILLDMVRANKDKFLGLLRRNGVLLNTKISAEDLTNTLLNAMKKSESLKKEVVLLMTTLTGNKDNVFADFSYSNTTGAYDFGGQYNFNPLFGSTTPTATTPPLTPTAPDKSTSSTKTFEDTTGGKIFGMLSGLADKYLQKSELDVRKVEAETAGQIAEQESKKESDSNVTSPKSNTGLYIALGIGGFALVGTLVYLISKKK